MKTIFAAYRISNLDRSATFYTTLGYVEVGRVVLDNGGRLLLLKFPDEPVATLELVYRPAEGSVEMGSGFDHLAVQVQSLDATVKELSEAGLEPESPRYPGGPDGPKISWLTDPDGYRIELVEWPPGHPGGITEADFA